MAGLLNDPEDLHHARRMLDAARTAVAKKEEVVTTTVFGREDYLQQMGALTALRKLRDEQEKIWKESTT